MIKLALILIVGIALSACSLDKTYVTAPQSPGGPLGGNEFGFIPTGVTLDGVNEINFYSTPEGLVLQSEDTSSKTVSAGGFNGGGLGNKAFIGLSQFGGTLISDITGFEVEARLERGSSYNYFNLQVDCDGDGNWTAGTDAIVVADSSTVPTLNFGASFSRVTINASDAVFKSVGAVCGLPSHNGSTGLALSALPATAKLFHGQTSDGGMPKNTSMSSVLFLMGDSGTRTSRQITVRELKVNGRTFSFHQTP